MLPSMNDGPVVEPLLDYADLATVARVAERTVRKWVAAGIGPSPVRIGRTVRFRASDVNAWLAEAVQQESA